MNRDEQYLRMVLNLAELGRGQTSPNPMVGAAVVKSGRILGRGYHRRAGAPHAEIMTLAEAGEKASGASLYVNLEPCCHYGRTRPCTDAIIEAGIKRVVYCIDDPNPKVNGKGRAILRRKGIKVINGLLAEEATKLNEAYLAYIKTGRPFVILKMAQSLDGRIAALSGDSKWISGKEALRLAHQLRADSDAVAVGAGTVRKDNPRLTVRLIKGKNPYRIIISHKLDFSLSSHLIRDNRDARTIVVSTEKALKRFRAKNVITWAIREEGGGLSLTDFLEKAGRFGIISLLIEGGARLATAFMRRGLVDKQYLIISPMTIGDGINGIGNLGGRTLGQAMKYDSWLFRPCGTDLLFEGYPRRK